MYTILCYAYYAILYYTIPRIYTTCYTCTTTGTHLEIMSMSLLRDRDTPSTILRAIATCIWYKSIVVVYVYIKYGELHY